jgi:dynein heavy chain
MLFCLYSRDEEWFLNQMNVQLGKHFDLTLHNLCPGNEFPVFGNFLNPWKIYEDLVDYGKLRKYLEEQMEKYNITPGVVHLDIVLFKDIIIHICRVIRVISQPQGNMLLIGIGLFTLLVKFCCSVKLGWSICRPSE